MKTTKIISIKPAGRQRVFNIHMQGPHHNYITSPSQGQPVHKNSHSCAYSVVAYWTAWLKAHYPAEWWASVVNNCDRDKIKKYINTARADGIKLNSIDIDNMASTFYADKSGTITMGLSSIKNIGDKKAEELAKISQDRLQKGLKYSSIDEFVEINGKSKIVMQRLIHLGAFKHLHNNTHAAWAWYLYKHGSASDEKRKMKELIRAKINERDGWTKDKIEVERKRQIEFFKSFHPKKKIPAKILNWEPNANNLTIEDMATIIPDYDAHIKFEFEREYLGYYIHSPLDLYVKPNNCTLREAREYEPEDENGATIAGFIESWTKAKSKNKNNIGRITLNDGIETDKIIVWSDCINMVDNTLQKAMHEKRPVKFRVEYAENERDSKIFHSLIYKKILIINGQARPNIPIFLDRITNVPTA
jgi:DNA polymerase III alpha subunit